MTTTSTEERVRDTQWMLRRHGVHTLSGQPQRYNALGGSRGIHVQPQGNDLRLTPYHPHPDRLMAIYADAILALVAEGWHVTPALAPEEGDKLMPALFAQPPARDYWRR